MDTRKELFNNFVISVARTKYALWDLGVRGFEVEYRAKISPAQYLLKVTHNKDTRDFDIFGTMTLVSKFVENFHMKQLHRDFVFNMVRVRYVFQLLDASGYSNEFSYGFKGKVRTYLYYVRECVGTFDFKTYDLVKLTEFLMKEHKGAWQCRYRRT